MGRGGSLQRFIRHFAPGRTPAGCTTASASAARPSTIGTPAQLGAGVVGCSEIKWVHPEDMNVYQRFRRIEELLGAPLTDALTDDHFQRLVREQVRETDDLDFKLGLYVGEKGRAELSKDVAGFANHVGGVIIVGIADVSGTASKIVPVDGVNDSEIRRIRSTVATRVHPFPRFDVLACRSSTSGKGFLVIVVGRSPIAPHAVSDPTDTGLRYWTRSGSQTLPLPEALVADRYRNRFSYAEARADRVGLVMHEGLVRLDRRRNPWVAVAVAPEIPGEMRLDGAMRQDLREWARRLPGTRFGGSRLFSGDNVTVGQRRVFMGDAPGNDGTVSGETAELHTDGTVFAAVSVYQDPEWGVSGPYRIFDIVVVDAVTACLRFAALHATQNAAAGGEALVEARIIEPRQGDDPPTNSLTMYWERAVSGFVMPDPIPGGRSLFNIAPSRHTVALDAIADSMSEWMAAARLVAGDLVQAFGLPETLQISPEGRLRTRYLGTGNQAIRTWATNAGIELDDGVVPF